MEWMLIFIVFVPDKPPLHIPEEHKTFPTEAACIETGMMSGSMLMLTLPQGSVIGIDCQPKVSA